jgi:hypothetical protein
MSLGYIITQVGYKMGLDPTNPAQRTVMLRFINEATVELYDQADMAGSLMEMVFRVNGDQTLSLPWYVGTIRAIRECASFQAWHVNQMRPRYNQFNWQDQWKNWRLRNKQCLQATVTNQSVVTINTFAVENPPVVVTLTGPTATASKCTEIITLNSTSVNSKNQFLDFDAISKNAPNLYDITINDVDGKLLTTIPNTELNASYQIIDVSTCPWLPQSQGNPQCNYMEVLYKRFLPILTNDGDEFPAFNYDNIIVNKVMQLWNEEQNKSDIALAYDNKATRSMARKHEDQNRETEDMVALVANPHDTFLRRIGSGLRRRYYFYAGRRQ